jgi:hypothetical protein
MALVHICTFTGSDTLDDEIFNQTGISGTSVSVPKTLFKPGVKYGIYIFSIMADFKFSGMVDNASAFKLRQSVASYFSMKPLK